MAAATVMFGGGSIEVRDVALRACRFWTVFLWFMSIYLDFVGKYMFVTH